VTVSKRINFLRWCLAYAHDRGLAPQPPRCPRLRNDGQVRAGLHTVAQWELFRQHVPPGRFRKLYDIGFWTGQHMPDVMSMTRAMLTADSFYRRNQKYRRCVAGWMPLQPEAALIVRELLEDVGPAPEALIAGRAWNLKRTWDMAADRAVAAGLDVPRVTPTDLRRSCASMLTARGWDLQAVRIFLGHATSDGRVMGGKGEMRPTVAERHYIMGTPGLFQPRTQSA
jgi:integrase